MQLAKDRSMIFIRVLLCVFLTVLLGGCANSVEALKSQKYQGLPHKYSQLDMKVGWDARTSDTGLSVDGYIWNQRWAYADGLELWVSLLDSQGRTMARDRGARGAGSLNKDEKSYFSVKFPVKPEPGSKLVFSYQYYGTEPTHGSAFWMQSFEAAL